MWVENHAKNRASYWNGSAGRLLIFADSGWRGLMSQFDSDGTNAEGSTRTALLRCSAKESPIAASPGGAGTCRQLEGSPCGLSTTRETLSGMSAATTTRSFGGSFASIWTKYSIIASERCSAVYAMRVPGLDQRPPNRKDPSPSNGVFE